MGKRKQVGSPRVIVRVESAEVEAYFSTLSGKARAEAIRQALGEYYDRTLEGSERKERALRRESDRLREEADLLNLQNIKERKRRAEFAGALEADKVKRQQAVLDALAQRRKDGKTVSPGWIDSQAGAELAAKLGSDVAEVLDLAKRGQP